MSSEMVKDHAIAVAEYYHAHLKMRASIGQLKCGDCDLMFNKQSSLSRHAQIHRAEFRCGKDSCDKAFSSPKLLGKHLSRHSDTKLVVRIVPFNIRPKIKIKEEQENNESFCDNADCIMEAEALEMRKFSSNDTAKYNLQMDHSGTLISQDSTSYLNPHSHQPQLMSGLISAESVETKLWLRGEMKRLGDLTIDSLFFRLIMLSSSAAFVEPQHSLTVFELRQLIEGQKEKTNRLIREEMDQLVNSLFLKLTNKLLMNMDWDRSGDVGDHSQLGNSSNQFESSKPQPSTSTSSFNPHQTDVSELMFKLIAAERVNSKLWLGGEMVQLADPMITSLFFRLITSTATVTPGHSSTVSELCHLIEGQKEETNRLILVDLDRVVNSLFLRLTNMLLVNMDWAESGDVVQDESVRGLGHPAVDNGNRPETEPEGIDGGNVETIEDIEQPSCKRRRVSTAQPNNLQSRLAIQSRRLVNSSQADQSQLEREQPHSSRQDRLDDEVPVNEDAQVIVVRLQCVSSGCEESFEGKSQLHDHMSTKHGIFPFRCLLKDCNRSFLKAALTEHFNRDHSNITKWQCGKCPRHFPYHKNLYQHNLAHHLKGQYQCGSPNCDTIFDLRYKVYNHFRVHHKPSLSCNDCAYQTRFKGNLNKHLLIHQNRKPFRCAWPDCSFSSNGKQSVLVHIKSQHTRVNPSNYVQVSNQ